MSVIDPMNVPTDTSTIRREQSIVTIWDVDNVVEGVEL